MEFPRIFIINRPFWVLLLWKPPCDAYIMHIGFSAAWMIHKIPDHVSEVTEVLALPAPDLTDCRARRAMKTGPLQIYKYIYIYIYIYIYVYLDSVCRWKLDCRDIVCTQKFPELIQALVMHTSQ